MALTVSDTTPNAGQTITVSGTGWFLFGGTVRIEIFNDPGTAINVPTSFASGTFTTPFTIPSSYSSGPKRLRASAAGHADEFVDLQINGAAVGVTVQGVGTGDNTVFQGQDIQCKLSGWPSGAGFIPRVASGVLAPEDAAENNVPRTTQSWVWRIDINARVGNHNLFVSDMQGTQIAQALFNVRDTVASVFGPLSLSTLTASPPAEDIPVTSSFRISGQVTNAGTQGGTASLRLVNVTTGATLGTKTVGLTDGGTSSYFFDVPGNNSNMQMGANNLRVDALIAGAVSDSTNIAVIIVEGQGSEATIEIRPTTPIVAGTSFQVLGNKWPTLTTAFVTVPGTTASASTGTGFGFWEVTVQVANTVPAGTYTVRAEAGDVVRTASVQIQSPATVTPSPTIGPTITPSPTIGPTITPSPTIGPTITPSPTASAEPDGTFLGLPTWMWLAGGVAVGGGAILLSMRKGKGSKGKVFSKSAVKSRR